MKEASKYFQAGAIVPVDMETTILLVNALKEALAQPAQEPVAKYSDIVSDGGLDPRNKFDAQPPQEPVAWLCSPDENGLFGLPTADKACKDCFPVYRQSPQPAQGPVANDRALQLVTYQMNHWKAYALELQERLVKYEGGAPMLLNKENNT